MTDAARNYDSEASRNQSAVGRTTRKADTGAVFHPASRPISTETATLPGGYFDKDGWPARWSDPTYLGDGPWGA